MNRLTSKLLAIVSFAAVFLATGTFAVAETPWQHHHPWRHQTNHRLAHQNARIKAGIANGTLTRHEAMRLHRRDHAIRHSERVDARAHHGHITKSEHHRLNHRLNRVSHRIHQERHMGH